MFDAESVVWSGVLFEGAFVGIEGGIDGAVAVGVGADLDAGGEGLGDDGIEGGLGDEEHAGFVWAVVVALGECAGVALE